MALGPDFTCVVCLAAARTATLVHGETGHIACCMECARVLKARGDRCPVGNPWHHFSWALTELVIAKPGQVCRMEIDLVIQHFWA